MSSNQSYDRAPRVASRIHRLMTEMLVTDLADPRLENVEVTRVSMTKDLRIARIYFYTVMEETSAHDLIKTGFVSAAGFIKRQISEKIGLKYTPEVQFYYDKTITLQQKIDNLFHEDS